MKLVNYIIMILFVGILSGQNIGFVGNSITHQGYGEIVGTHMPEYTIYNFGVGGVTVEGYKSTGRYQDVLNTHPGIIVILLGTNDWRYFTNRDDSWRDQWQSEYQSLINTFNVWSDVYVGTIPYQTWSDEPDFAIEGMNSRIRGMYNKKGVIDFNSVLGKNSKYFQDDGVHPNDNGQNEMATAALIALSISNSGTAPETPKNLKALPGDGHVTLTWDANTEPDLSVYFLFRGTNESGGTTGLKTFAKYFTSYIDTNVVNGTTYYYQIGAGDSLDHRSRKSEPVIATPNKNIDNIPPHTPIITSTSVMPNNILLQWSDVNDIDLDHYNIYRSTISEFNPQEFDKISIVNKMFHEFSDRTIIEPHTSYYYKISAVDTANNESNFSNQASITSLAISNESMISNYKLGKNYPNPFNPTTNIRFTIKKETYITIEIYDVSGNFIKQLESSIKQPGKYSVIWNSTDSKGKKAPSGIYFYQLKTIDFVETRKMVLMN